MPPTPRVVGIDLAKHLVHHAVPVAIEVAGHALGGSHATCAQEFNLTSPLPGQNMRKGEGGTRRGFPLVVPRRA